MVCAAFAFRHVDGFSHAHTTLVMCFGLIEERRRSQKYVARNINHQRDHKLFHPLFSAYINARRCWEEKCASKKEAKAAWCSRNARVEQISSSLVTQACFDSGRRARGASRSECISDFVNVSKPQNGETGGMSCFHHLPLSSPVPSCVWVRCLVYQDSIELFSDAC